MPLAQQGSCRTVSLLFVWSDTLRPRVTLTKHSALVANASKLWLIQDSNDALA